MILNGALVILKVKYIYIVWGALCYSSLILHQLYQMQYRILHFLF